MMKQYFEGMVGGIERSLQEHPEGKSPRKMYALEIAKLGQRLYSGEERVSWCGITAPFDLLSAMGVTSCFVEFIGAMLAATGMVGSFIEHAEQEGYASDTCGYHRSVMGAAMKGLMPVPDFLVATTNPCTGGLAIMENLAERFKKDLFVLHVPQELTVDNVRYLAGQIEELARFASAHTGDRLDEDRLKEAVLMSNEARSLMEETYVLAQHVPSPANGHVLSNFGIVMALLLGTEGGVEVARTFRDDFADKVEKGIAGVKNERLRLLWIQNRIQFKNPLVKMVEEEYGAVVVSDELNSITWDPVDPEDPFMDFARRAISIPFNGEGSQRIDHLKGLARDYRIDGAINPCNWGCRQGTGSRGLISEGLKEIGVPVLNLEVDCVDSRSFAEGQLRTRLEAFLEMLDGRPSPWK